MLQAFKSQLKKELLEASFSARHLASGDYDRYFRDTGFVDIQGNLVLVFAKNPAVAAEGLQKYKSRLEKIFTELTGMDVEFRLLNESHLLGRRLAPVTPDQVGTANA